MRGTCRPGPADLAERVPWFLQRAGSLGRSRPRSSALCGWQRPLVQQRMTCLRRRRGRSASSSSTYTVAVTLD